MNARSLRAFPLLVLLCAAGSPLACNADSTPCYPGDYRACACDNGVQGLFQCSATGDGYGACDCSGKIPGAIPTTSDAGGDAHLDAAADGTTGSLGAFGTSCGKNEDCTSKVCFMGGMGSYCSLPCTPANMFTACPKPLTSGTCNMMGYCKK